MTDRKSRLIYSLSMLALVFALISHQFKLLPDLIEGFLYGIAVSGLLAEMFRKRAKGSQQ